MFKWTDINKIKIIIIPAKAIFLYFSNKTPIPNVNSRIPVNKSIPSEKGKNLALWVSRIL